ncbi:MAG: AgmX/PglI C-terminal domain-containing protein [Myxococcota bacterium]
MQEPNTQDEQALRSQLGQSRERLDDLVRNLEAIDGELEDLAAEREQYRLLGEACSALEELSAQGVSALFWRELAPNGSGEEHVLRVRRSIDSFDKRASEVEERRQAILAQIDGEQDRADFLEDDLLEIQRLEEERKLEWIVEREPGSEPTRPTIMPWTRGGEDDERFRKSLLAALLLSLFLGLVFPMIELPLPEAWETAEVPERFTQLIREEQPLPPQQPVPTRPETETESQSQEEAADPKPTPDQSPAPTAESKGILAFREKFSGLAEDVEADRLGARARINSSGAVGSSRTQRSLVATQASQSSGGINLSSLSRDVGGGSGEGIEGVQVARATSSIGGTGEVDRPLSNGPGPSRTDEEIQIVFDRHKAALYRLYNRELRRNPTLQGQMVLRLTIEPDGSVSLCELKSTDMDAPQLAAQVVARVKTFDFGAKDGIPPVTILYPIDFLPAS